jgi:hypothetical protein
MAAKAIFSDKLTDYLNETVDTDDMIRTLAEEDLTNAIKKSNNTLVRSYHVPSEILKPTEQIIKLAQKTETSIYNQTCTNKKMYLESVITILLFLQDKNLCSDALFFRHIINLQNIRDLYSIEPELYLSEVVYANLPSHVRVTIRQSILDEIMSQLPQIASQYKKNKNFKPREHLRYTIPAKHRKKMLAYQEEQYENILSKLGECYYFEEEDSDKEVSPSSSIFDPIDTKDNNNLLPIDSDLDTDDDEPGDEALISYDETLISDEEIPMSEPISDDEPPITYDEPPISDEETLVSDEEIPMSEPISDDILSRYSDNDEEDEDRPRSGDDEDIISHHSDEEDEDRPRSGDDEDIISRHSDEEEDEDRPRSGDDEGIISRHSDEEDEDRPRSGDDDDIVSRHSDEEDEERPRSDDDIVSRHSDEERPRSDNEVESGYESTRSKGGSYASKDGCAKCDGTVPFKNSYNTFTVKSGDVRKYSFCGPKCMEDWDDY